MQKVSFLQNHSVSETDQQFCLLNVVISAL